MVNGVKDVFSSNDEKDLIEFYRKKFEELKQDDDEYIKKVDKYLKDLIADRHDLSAEMQRRSEKITDLQKALVEMQFSCFEEREKYLKISAENEQLKKNEEKLHSDIRKLLSSTKDRDLRDQIIYILEDPKVEIGYRCQSSISRKNSGSSIMCNKKSSTEDLKEQIQSLQSKIDNHTKLAQNRSDVILEDCKRVLLQSKQKFLDDEEELKKLHKKFSAKESELIEIRNEILNLQGNFRCLEANNTKTSYSKEGNTLKSVENLPSYNYSKSTSKVTPKSTSNKFSNNFISNTTDMHLSLVLLSKILTKVFQILYKIQATDVYVQTAKLSKTSPTYSSFVDERDIVQFQNYIRQCTRLSFDVSNIWKSLQKALFMRDEKASFDVVDHFDRELKDLESSVEELAIATAEVDLLTINLSQATFFEFLTKPKQTFEKFGVKELNNHSKYVSDMEKLETNLKFASNYTSKALSLSEKILQNYESMSLKNQENYSKINKNQEELVLDSKEVIEGLFKKRSIGVEDSSNSKNCEKKDPSTCMSFESADLVRKIDKALSKIKQLENRDYAKDSEIGEHLGKQINALREQLKDFYDEFSIKSFQEDFSEYTSMTLNKLEALAKQSRDAVTSAEAQIAAHRSTAKLLTQKLRETEDLLRVSIHECLALKQKLQYADIDRESDRANFRNGLKEKLVKVQDFDELETAIKEVASAVHMDKGQTTEPFECRYCKQGSSHKLCEEKIKELRANCRKLTTEIKLCEQELKEEKKISKLNHDKQNKIGHEILGENENLRSKLQSLETKNNSLIEQLNLERNRLKKMERFQHLQIEGFQTDIKNLKTKIQDLEKQLMKAVLIFDHDKKDLELLQTVHTTAQRSTQVISSVKRLKAKLYDIENYLKHI